MPTPRRHIRSDENIVTSLEEEAMRILNSRDTLAPLQDYLLRGQRAYLSPRIAIAETLERVKRIEAIIHVCLHSTEEDIRQKVWMALSYPKRRITAMEVREHVSRIDRILPLLQVKWREIQSTLLREIQLSCELYLRRTIGAVERYLKDGSYYAQHANAKAELQYALSQAREANVPAAKLFEVKVSFLLTELEKTGATV